MNKKMSRRATLDKQLGSIPILKRLQKSKKMIAEMCSEGRPPKTSIPPQYTDEDIYIIKTINDAIPLVEDLSETVDALVNFSDSLSKCDPDTKEAIATIFFQDISHIAKIIKGS